MLTTDAALVRAIPLPTARDRRSVTVTFPSHPVVDALFGRLGGAQPVADEAAFDARSLSGLAAEHESPKGNNERIRTTWFDPANSEALGKALDGLLADLRQPRS
ncbi:hypothetical protein [Streptomyces sp. MZ04]|uniref:hypothetical protein n=1 Tax=Streptomyces sp. MZ04 TaxID=2559236 RepID=UPI001FD80EB4|nr:hypothetical protein [Streptomyces sp. MZ04]